MPRDPRGRFKKHGKEYGSVSNGKIFHLGQTKLIRWFNNKGCFLYLKNSNYWISYHWIIQTPWYYQLSCYKFSPVDTVGHWWNSYCWRAENLSKWNSGSTSNHWIHRSRVRLIGKLRTNRYNSWRIRANAHSILYSKPFTLYQWGEDENVQLIHTILRNVRR